MTPNTPEQPGGISNTQEANVFDNIEEIAVLLKKNKLSLDEVKQVRALLTEIADKTKELDGKVQSYFQDKVLERLQKLLPQHPFFQELNEDSVEFVDSVDLLIDGQESFERIIESIRTAEKSIYVNIFIWRDDQIGNQIAKEILLAADRGVKVTIVKDRLGAIFEHAEQGKQSLFHKELSPDEKQKTQFVDAAYNQPGEANSKQKANPITQKLLDHPNITVQSDVVQNDHSKYYIFDDSRIITGGMNIGDEYHKDWHDYMVEANSPLLVQKFRERLTGGDDYDEGSSIEFSLNVPSKLLENKEIEPMVKQLLHNAKSEIIIEMAYFGDQDITDAIVNAVNRGVEVKIIVPQKANIQDSLNRRIIREILQKTDNKAKVYLFPRMLHAKLIHVDGRITFLGSANLNEEATERLGELNVVVNDANTPFTSEVRKQLLEDISNSKHAQSSDDVTWSPVDPIRAYFEQNAVKFSGRQRPNDRQGMLTGN